MHIRLLLTACMAWLVAAIDDPPDTSTIVDILSSSAQYSLLLHHLQTAGLISLINTSRNATLLAPVNSAFQDIPASLISKDFLLYHLVNGTVATADIHSAALYHSYLPSPNVEDSSGMPVLFQNISGVATVNHVVPIVSPDHFAGRERGVVQAILQVLVQPHRVCDVISALPDCKLFTKIFQIEYSCDDEYLPYMMTFLVPTDAAFTDFDKIELDYMLSVHAGDDRRKIIDRHIIPQLLLPQNIPADGHINVTTYDDVVLDVDEKLVLDNRIKPVAPHVLASDGVLHVYNKFVTSKHEVATNQQLITLTPEKYLYGLDYASFVHEVFYAGLQDLINERSLNYKQTIFIPSSASSEQLPDLSSSDNEQTQGLHSSSLTLYHFMDAQLSLEDIQHRTKKHKLLTTKYKSTRMGGFPQRVKFTLGKRNKGVWFLNGHRVTSNEYRIGNTSIYVIDGDLDLPPSLSLALGPFFQSSYSLEFLENLDLLDLPLAHHHAYTYLVPSRTAWEQEKLVTKYLKNNDTALGHVFEALIFQTPLYTDDFEPKNVTFINGNTGMVRSSYSEHKKKSIIEIDDQLTLHVEAEDILFDTGVVHCIEEVPIPSTVSITAEQLIIVGGREFFLDLLEARNLSFVVNPDSDYTILVPSESSLRKANITADSQDIDRLLAMHILPGNPIGQFMAGDEGAATLADGVELSCRNVSDRVFFISVANGLGHEAYVTQLGSTHGSFNGSKSTVLFLDKYISPDWIKPPFIRPPFRLKTHVAMLIGAAVTIIIIFVVISGILYTVVGKDSEAISSSSSNTSDEERDHLIGDGSRVACGSSDGYGSISTAANDYDVSPTAPIRTKKVQEEREFGRHLNLPGR